MITKPFLFVGVLKPLLRDPALGTFSIELGSTPGELGIDAQLRAIEVQADAAFRRLRDMDQSHGKVLVRVNGTPVSAHPSSSLACETAFGQTVECFRRDTVVIEGPTGLTVKVHGLSAAY